MKIFEIELFCMAFAELENMRPKTADSAILRVWSQTAESQGFDRRNSAPKAPVPSTRYLYNRSIFDETLYNMTCGTTCSSHAVPVCGFIHIFKQLILC